MKIIPIKKIHNKGAILVEFALVLPILIALVMGIIEFSWAFYHLNILNKAVQDGARYFSDYSVARYDGDAYSLSYPINTSSSNTKISEMENLIIYGNLTGTGDSLLPSSAPDITVYCHEENTSNKVCGSSTSHIRVTAVYTHNFVIGSSYTFNASSVMRVE